MTTNAELIVEARGMADTSAIYGPKWPNANAYIVHARTLLPQLADALEASEAQVAELRVCPDANPSWRHYQACHNPKDWPADLLAAVSVAAAELVCGCEDNTDCRHTRATATFVRYGLLPEEAR